ncbi:hypothetical protein KR074_009407, partial [Drosophila pseudoananassae]
MNVEEITRFSVAELRDKLRELRLPSSGLKAVLQERLISYFEGENIDQEEESSEKSVYEETNVLESDFSNSQPSAMAFTLRDIEDSLSAFTGNGSPDINKQWLADFELNFITVGWTDLQKFIYGRQLVQGAAKLFLGSQPGINDWDVLKQALKNEFGEKLTAKQVHKMLENRKKTQKESFLEYFYSKTALANQSKLDEESIIEYIVEGIPDSKQNKNCLYQASNLKEF